MVKNPITFGPRSPGHQHNLEGDMPNLAVYHPQIVHFVIALAFVGVILRLVSFTPWFAFANVAARTLILVAATAGMLAVRSGTDAHDPVERIPGAREAVVEHEDAGKWARTALLVVAALELAAWGLSKKQPRIAKGVVVAGAVAGVVMLAAVYEAAEHGGTLVYGYAGGVGIRSGNPEDVDRLVVAALYNGAQTDRGAGRAEAAARLIDELARRRPGDPAARFLVADSRIRDRHDPRGALALLDSLAPAAGDSAPPRVRFQLASLRADAYLALGLRDSARLALEALGPAGARNPRIRERLHTLR